mmetsp:Transcript_3155/g.6529  ORF Transcript_3155/g.6529 Transcript_3155/m.6529 type:complete len:178 (-) Transcript_3155:817-1350(-)
MALKKELGFLFRSLIERSETLPSRVRGRTVQEVKDMFTGFEDLEDSQALQALKIEAENKLSLLELSTPSFKPSQPETPGVKKYVMKDGQLSEGSEAPKLAMDYSNWYAGNVDPQELRRHKELMDRQHYSGPFWENRPRNPSIIDEENPTYDYVPPEPHPPESLRKEKEEDSWELIKR